MRRKAVGGIAAACALATLAASTQALAGFGAGASASLTVSSAVLDAPTAPSAAAGACVPLMSVSVDVAWTPSTSPAVDGYAIYRADGGGSAAQIGTVAGNAASSFVDTSAAFSTDYAYDVVAVRGGWTSAATPPAAVTTPGSNCA